MNLIIHKNRRQILSLFFISIGIVFNLISSRTQLVTDGPIVCIFRLSTGWPCPFCGTTRAFGQLSQGHILESIYLNPAALVISLGFILWIFRVQWLVKVKNKINSWFSHQPKWKRNSTFVLIFVAIWVLNILRVDLNYYPTV